MATTSVFCSKEQYIFLQYLSINIYVNIVWLNMQKGTNDKNRITARDIQG